MNALNVSPRLTVFVLIALLAGCDRGPTELRLVAPSSDLDYEIVSDLAATLNEGSEFRLVISDEQEPGEAALDKILAGEADLALVSNYLPFRENVATIMPVYPSVLHIAYREGRDASNGFTLLENATVFAGAEGSASRLMFERIADRIGLSADRYSFVENTTLSENQDLDIAVIFAPISPQRRSELVGFNLYSFGTPADIGTGTLIDAATLLNPPLRAFIIPASTYGAANADPVVTVAVDKILVARHDLSPSIVYDLVNAVRRARPALAANRPGLFDRLGDSFDVSKSTFVLHPGTQNFLQRDEPTIYERYSGVAEVVVTLMIGIISASFALFRIIKIRRKNRIDEYYSAALAIRDKLTASQSEDDVYLAVEEIQALQDKAFAQLVDEKLAADESFRIFMSLSNDILDQAGKR